MNWDLFSGSYILSETKMVLFMFKRRFSTSVPHIVSHTKRSIGIISSCFIFTVEGKTVHTNSQTVILKADTICNLSYVLFWTYTMLHYINLIPHLCTSVFEFTSESTHSRAMGDSLPINLMLRDHPSILECEGKHFSMNSAGESPAVMGLHCEGQIVLYSI